MTEVATRLDVVSQTLFQNLGIREAFLCLPVPQQNLFWLSVLFGAGRDVCEVDGEDATGSRDESDLANGGSEGRQEFLAKVCGSEHPSTLRTVRDGNAW